MGGEGGGMGEEGGGMGEEGGGMAEREDIPSLFLHPPTPRNIQGY